MNNRIIQYWGASMIEGALARSNQVQIGKLQGGAAGNNIAIPGQELLDDVHFVLKRSRDSWEIVDLTGGSSTFVEGQELRSERAPGSHYHFEWPIFIYGAPGVDGPRFLFGFDPTIPDMWLLDHHHPSGAEVVISHLCYDPTGRGVCGLRDVNLRISPCEFVGMYGGSGTGKTTLVELILGVNRVKVNGGSVTIDGVDLGKGNAPPGVAYLPQHVDFPGLLKCRDLLYLTGRDRGMSHKEITTAIMPGSGVVSLLDRCRLDHSILEKQVDVLSGGERRRLALAVTLLRAETNLLVADEPTSGLDPENERLIISTLRRISRQGVTVVVITHAAGVLRCFDRVIVLRRASNKPTSIAFDGRWAVPAAESEHEKSDTKEPAEVPHDDRLWLRDYPELWGHNISDLSLLSFLMNETSEGEMPGNPAGTLADHRAVQLKTRNVAQEPQCPLHEKILAHMIQFVRNHSIWLRWTWVCLGLHWVDRKTLYGFAFLSMLCAIAMAVGLDSDRHPLVISLFVVATAWLTATYATVFTSRLLRFYAFEMLAGLRAGSFIIAVWLSSTLPALLMSLIFAGVLYLRPNINGWITLAEKADTVVETMVGILQPIGGQTGEVDVQRDATAITSDSAPRAEQDARTAANSQRGVVERGVRFFCPNHCYSWEEGVKGNLVRHLLWSPMSSHELGMKLAQYYPGPLQKRLIASDETGARDVLTPKFVLLTILVLFAVSWFGAVLGITAMAFWRNERLALTTLVVYFICALIFSRATGDSCDAAYYGPWQDQAAFFAAASTDERIQANYMFTADSAWKIVPYGLSFFSVARYGFNGVCYATGNWAAVVELFPLLMFALLLLCWTAIWYLGNRDRMTTFITRKGNS